MHACKRNCYFPIQKFIIINITKFLCINCHRKLLIFHSIFLSICWLHWLPNATGNSTAMLTMWWRKFIWSLCRPTSERHNVFPPIASQVFSNWKIEFLLVALFYNQYFSPFYPVLMSLKSVVVSLWCFDKSRVILLWICVVLLCITHRKDRILLFFFNF